MAALSKVSWMAMAVLWAVCPGFVEAQPALDGNLRDPAVDAFFPNTEVRTRKAPDYPAEAFVPFGSSLVVMGHLAHLGWSEEQFGFLLDGMGQAFHSRMKPLGSRAQRLAAEAGRRMAAAVKDPQATPDPFPEFSEGAFSEFGMALLQSGHFGELGWSDAQFDAFVDGMRQAFHERPAPMNEMSRTLAADSTRRIAEAKARTRQLLNGGVDPKLRLARYMKEMRLALQLQISDDGLGFNVEPATENGVRPRPGDTIVISCDAAAADAVTKLPQLSADHIRVKMEGMMPGLMEGLQMMTVGNKAVFVIPPELSFGDGTWPEGVPPGTPLVYTVELHEVTAAGARH